MSHLVLMQKTFIANIIRYFKKTLGSYEKCLFDNLKKLFDLIKIIIRYFKNLFDIII